MVYDSVAVFIAYLFTWVECSLVYPGLPHVGAVRQQSNLGVGIRRAAEVSRLKVMGL